jgi:MtrB/PioB family decaheme-associated outer membrane protein
VVGGSEMKVRREILKARAVILLAGAMAIAAGSATSAGAADVMPVKAEPAPVDQGWYFHGGFDVGGRFYAQKPDDGTGKNANGTFLLPTQTESIAKYEEYGKIPAGLFMDWIKLDIGSNDGRYRFNFLGKDVGYDAQSYKLDFSEAGKQYLSLGWDQTPHIWSTSAVTLFSGVGSDNLTVSNSVQAALQQQWSAASGSNAAGLAARNAINTIIDSNATQTDLIMQRDKFSAAYRITPTPEWDFNISYSHEHRSGEKPGTLNYTYAPPNGSFPSNTIGVPVPVDDVTQTPKASGEYVGAGPWGRFSFKLAYAGSIYTDNLTELKVENPFGNTGATINFGNGTLTSPLPPSNQAHAFSASGSTDIPVFKSRFTTTNQYSRWTQNESFIDTSNNGLTADPLPASSLNGVVNNFLTNNVLTSSFTDTLHNKLRVRYYEHNNDTAELEFTNVVLADSELSAGPFTPEFTSYKRTNIDEDLTWNPVRWFTIGAGYGWERWDRSDNRFATETNENIGRMFANTQLTNWMQWRISYSYGARRYNGYEIDDGGWLNSRMFDLANRNEQKMRTLFDIQVTDSITITPNGGLRWDDYPETTALQTGVSSDHSWNAGVDLGVVVNPNLRFNFGYSYEQDKLAMSAAVPDAAGTSAGNACNAVSTINAGTDPAYTVPAACIWGDNITQTYHTFLASVNWKVIPSKLDFRVSYVASWERESYDFQPCPGNFINCNGLVTAGTTATQDGLPWPDDTNLYQRLDATLRYYFDPDTLRQMGWKGKVIAKLRYTYERNDGSYWQSDALSAYFGTLTGNTELTGTSRSTFLAYDNPNYTVQLIAASLTFKW